MAAASAETAAWGDTPPSRTVLAEELEYSPFPDLEEREPGEEGRPGPGQATVSESVERIGDDAWSALRPRRRPGSFAPKLRMTVPLEVAEESAAARVEPVLAPPEMARGRIGYAIGLSVSTALFASTLTMFAAWRATGTTLLLRPANALLLAACALGWSATSLAGLLAGRRR